ncbi:hypothetical protein Vadar_026532 [Vaccinium darrowii]|uniref:Uncharacterized protein n=1 Tax=Vaccinium darrowii TaxID=229202 RepID=A0ACB7YAE9_9ERIC|nr:hypothetical protein Vadar_026532 [Vaccinium darrowii]
MVQEVSLAVSPKVFSADLEGLNPKSDSYVHYSYAAQPTTQVDKGDGKSRDWIDVLVLTVSSGSEGPSRDVVIGHAIVPVRQVHCWATLTAYQGGEQIVPYRVVSPSGKPIGTLNVSFRFDDMVAAPSEEAASAAARELSQGFDEVGRGPVTKYPAPSGASKAYAEYTTWGYARYALPQPQDSVYAPAGYALPPAVYGGFAPPPQLGYGYPPQAVVQSVAPTPQQVNKKKKILGEGKRYCHRVFELCSSGLCCWCDEG